MCKGDDVAVVWGLLALMGALLTLIGLEVRRRWKGREAVLAAKSACLASVSHDLRTPLTAVISLSQLLQEGGLPPDEVGYDLHMIEESGKTMLKLVKDLLDLTNLEAGRLSIQREPTDVHLLLADSLPLFKQMVDRAHQTLILEKSEIPVLMLDPHRLRQILFNLVENAVQHAGPCTVRVSMTYDGRMFSLVVADDGWGLSPKEAKRLMGCKARIHPSDPRKGTGLGLSICRQLAARMGGTLTLDSELGAGCRFTLSIPAARVAGDLIPRQVA